MAEKPLRVTLPSVSLPGIKLPKEPLGWGRTEIHIMKRAEGFVNSFPDREPAGEVPGWFKMQFPGATKPEWAVWWALTKLGKSPDTDFMYRARMPGVGSSYYSTVDFLLQRDNLAIEVSGEYWHYGAGSDRQFHDQMRYTLFAGEGIEIVFIDEDDAISRPLWVVREALAFRDHSKLRRRF